MTVCLAPALALCLCGGSGAGEATSRTGSDTVRVYEVDNEGRRYLSELYGVVHREGKPEPVRQGVYVRLYPDSTTKAIGYYDDGLKDSLWTKFYPNGQKYEEAYYREGKLNGRLKAWYEDGSSWFDGIYTMNSLDTVTMWHGNGERMRFSVFGSLYSVTDTCWDADGKSIPCKQSL